MKVLSMDGEHGIIEGAARRDYLAMIAEHADRNLPLHFSNLPLTHTHRKHSGSVREVALWQPRSPGLRAPELPLFAFNFRRASAASGAIKRAANCIAITRLAARKHALSEHCAPKIKSNRTVSKIIPSLNYL